MKHEDYQFGYSIMAILSLICLISSLFGPVIVDSKKTNDESTYYYKEIIYSFNVPENVSDRVLGVFWTSIDGGLWNWTSKEFQLNESNLVGFTFKTEVKFYYLFAINGCWPEYGFHHEINEYYPSYMQFLGITSRDISFSPIPDEIKMNVSGMADGGNLLYHNQFHLGPQMGNLNESFTNQSITDSIQNLTNQVVYVESSWSSELNGSYYRDVLFDFSGNTREIRTHSLFKSLDDFRLFHESDDADMFDYIYNPMLQITFNQSSDMCLVPQYFNFSENVPITYAGNTIYIWGAGFDLSQKHSFLNLEILNQTLGINQIEFGYYDQSVNQFITASQFLTILESPIWLWNGMLNWTFIPHSLPNTMTGGTI